MYNCIKVQEFGEGYPDTYERKLQKGNNSPIIYLVVKLKKYFGFLEIKEK